MSYLNCPNCGLSVVLSDPSALVERCPRCLVVNGQAVDRIPSIQPGGGSLGRRLRPGELRIEHHSDGRCHQVVLTGELDIASAPALERAVGRLCADGALEVALDLGALAFIDSFGLGTIIHAQDMCNQHGCAFSLIPGPPAVQRLFELTCLTDRFMFREAIVVNR
jgi:anti-sigma B factor antagonist